MFHAGGTRARNKSFVLSSFSMVHTGHCNSLARRTQTAASATRFYRLTSLKRHLRSTAGGPAITAGVRPRLSHPHTSSIHLDVRSATHGSVERSRGHPHPVCPLALSLWNCSSVTWHERHARAACGGSGRHRPGAQARHRHARSVLLLVLPRPSPRGGGGRSGGTEYTPAW